MLLFCSLCISNFVGNTLLASESRGMLEGKREMRRLCGSYGWLGGSARMGGKDGVNEYCCRDLCRI